MISVPAIRSAPGPGALPAVLAVARALGRRLPLLLLVLLVAAPVLAVFSYIAAPTDGLFAHLARTVLADYVRNTVLLAVGVAALTAVTGAGTAWLVTMYSFPGRALLGWALVLPLAMPAYVLAYTYTDFLQVTGPLQGWLRALTGWSVRDYWFPEIRSPGGAIFVLSAVLYPYVYVLARAAFLEQSQCALEVSRTLGCTAFRAFHRVGLPLARPAIVSGMAFAVMEALADFGAVSFFGVQTFTTGIYRAWYALGSPGAAAQLASILLLVIFAVLSLERLSRGRARFANNTTHIYRKHATPLRGWHGAAAAAACALPILLGFVVPVLVLCSMALQHEHWLTPARLAEITANTAILAALAAVVVVTVALAGLLGASRDRSGLSGSIVRVATLGYATPGAVIGVGIVVTLGGVDATIDRLANHLLGISTGLLVGGTVLAVTYGYLSRFFAIAFNPLEAGFAKISPSVGDAARVLGCTRVAAFGRIQLPLLRASLMGALLLVFVDVMKELPATLILRPFNFDTLAVEAYRLAMTERLAEAALPSFLIVLAGLAPVIILCRMLAGGRREA